MLNLTSMSRAHQTTEAQAFFAEHSRGLWTARLIGVVVALDVTSLLGFLLAQ